MNERQIKLLELLNQNRYFTNSELAETLSVSTRTIRNDLEKITQELNQANINYDLTKKPGVGIKFSSPDQALIEAKFINSKSIDGTDYERQVSITYMLLTSDNIVTLDLLSENFFVPKNTIRQDLETIKSGLKNDQLTLNIRTKLGISLDGAEKDKRALLTKILHELTNQVQNKKSIKDFFKDSDVELVEGLVKELEAKYNLTSSGTTFNSIVIHLLFMIQRTQEEESVTLSSEEWNLIQYSSALKMAQEISDTISLKRSIKFTKEEIGYLALRIAAYYTNHDSDAFLTDEIKQQISEIIIILITKVHQITGYDLSDDLLLQKNLKTHLQSTFTRILTGAHITNPLKNKIQQNYPQQFMIVQEIVEDFATLHNFKIPLEEVAYLTVHIQGAIERLNQRDIQSYQTVIVCNYGVGISAFIEAKLERLYQNLKVIDHLSIDQITDYSRLNELDFVISTVKLDLPDLETIQITPLFELEDQAKLQNLIHRLPIKQTINHVDLEKYTNPFLVWPKLEVNSKTELLTLMANRCFQQGLVTENFLATVLSREERSSTRVGEGISLPHGKPSEVLESFISIATLKTPISWDEQGNNLVNLVILIGFNDSILGQTETKQLFSFLNYLVQEKTIYEQIINEDNPLKLLKRLSQS